MASLFKYREPKGNGLRQKGFARYMELLERDMKKFLLVNLFTLLGFTPFVLGVLYAILSTSILVLLPACIIGGAIAGPALACMYDAVFRSLREAPGRCLENYKRALKQNWRQSIIPGMIFCLMLGFYTFMIMLFWWSSRFPGWGTLAVYCFGLVLFTAFFSLYWPQVVLFEQNTVQRCRNCLLFFIQFLWKTLGCSLLQLAYWAVIVLFLPFSVLLLPLTGIWFILFTASFLLYSTMDNAFHIEEQIAEAFPEQAVIYEDDQAWLKRKQTEEREGRAKSQ